MTLETWICYVLTVLALMSTPGPSQLLMLSVSSRCGFRSSLATAIGDLSANAIQMLAAGLGLATIIAASEGWLSIIKWMGVCYLSWLGISMILNEQKRNLTTKGSKPNLSSWKSLWLQGFLGSAVNPKAIVFFAALFPQFISGAHPVLPQVLILASTYIVMDGLFLSIYGMTADSITKRLKGQGEVLIGRLGGICMIAAAVLLSLRTVSPL